ncbi:MAG: hypothetical protein CVV22_12725 [Ignavibacteriae bacterium HGW-Ignavibacteriae-1]|jgi:uncharacterized membrane protein|nr:MAG: hypothetical protein CVV22_12725 [Ignavibacteriae bacterium HGW-Ignavibacteriae-1]
MNRFLPNVPDHSKESPRLHFIDLVRAYAILMMVQGHMIDATLAMEFRDNANFFYNLWNHMRGITAPVFFFASGTIFTYLLMRKNVKFTENERVTKGLKRFVMLIILGYLLRFNFGILADFPYLDFMKYKYSFAADVLHCIGFSILTIISFYIIHQITRIPIWIFLSLSALSLFYFYPSSLDVDWLAMFPLPIATYFTLDYGANFTIIPWMGFSLWGALLGYILSKNVNIAFNYIFTFIIFALGLILHFGSGGILDLLFNLTGDMNLKYLLYNNYLFYHLGNTLIICGVISFIANTVKIPKLLAKTGQKTMMIYVVHIFIIYGTALNNGFMHYYKYSFVPWQSILAAVLLIAFFLILVKYIDGWKQSALDLFNKFKNKLHH